MKYSLRFLFSTLGLTIGLAHAATFTVPGDFPNIGTAIQSVPDKSTIIVEDGTYGLIVANNIGKELLIISRNGPDSTFIDGGGSSNLLQVQNEPAFAALDKEIVFSGFTFRNGRQSGPISPIYIADAEPQFLNCIFESNSATSTGGAITITGNNVRPVFADCLFQNNSTGLFGGAVLVNGGNPHPNPTFLRCTFLNNSSTNTSVNSQGGAILFSQGSGRIIDSLFQGNSCYYSGGAVKLLNDWADPNIGTLEIEGTTFLSNTNTDIAGSNPPTEGGAINIENKVHLIVKGSQFNDNTAEAGAGIHVYRGQLTVESCIFEENTSIGTNLQGYGGAIGISLADRGDPIDRPEYPTVISDTLILNNTAPDAGGISAGGDDVNAKPLSLTLTDVALVGNTATTANNSRGNGGGLSFNLVNVNATRLYLLNNHAENVGGGIVMVGNATLTTTDSVLVGNTADLQDDLLHQPTGTPPTYNSTTIAFNGTSSGGSFEMLEAVPARSYSQTAWLTYVRYPYDTPTITPGGNVVGNDGGYAAGAYAASNISSDTNFTLNTGGASPSVNVPFAYFSCPDDRGYPAGIPTLPADLEAENFNSGGLRRSHYDRSVVNSFGAYRVSDSVDIFSQGPRSNGHAIGDTSAGEWLEFMFFCEPGNYIGDIHYASPDGGWVGIQTGENRTTSWIELPSTGSVNTYQTVSIPLMTFADPFGEIRLVIIDGDHRIDRLEILSQEPVIGSDVTTLSQTFLIDNFSTKSLRFNIRNVGGKTLDFTVSDNQPWLDLSGTSGSSTGSNVPFDAIIDPTGLTEGTYTGLIEVTDPDALNSPFRIRVYLHILTERAQRNDFDGDGLSDIGCYFAPGGNWYTFSSTLGFAETQFGFDGTLPVTGDFDGDGRTDIGCYFPGGGNWYFFQSTLGFDQTVFGFEGTLPITGDFDGDAVDDFGLYHPPSGTWYFFQSTDGYSTTQFGFLGTLPVVGDFDGDGKDDFGCYHPPTGRWFLFQSQQGFRETQFGFLGTLPVVGDFDGDGKDDFGCYHPPTGRWFLFQSQLGFRETQFGFLGTLPVVGDYDGDDKDDFGCYHPPTGRWFLFRSRLGFRETQFGFLGTLPL